MSDQSIQTIEHEIALLVRLTMALSPQLGQLDRSGYLLLSHLVDGTPLAINVLAEALKLNLSTASRQVATLEAKGLIRRFPDEKNGRISLVEITPEGQEILHRVKKARYNAYAEILHDYSPEDLQTLENALTRLNQSLIRWER